MTDLRFVLAAFVAFVAAFAGVSFGMPWMSKGAAVATVSPSPAKHETPATAPAASTVAAVLPAPAPAAGPPPPPALPRAVSGGRLAQTALQAAQDFARAPCDRMAKAAFVVAASTYLRARDTGAPDDPRVHAAIKSALETGQIGADDIPPDLVTFGPSALAPQGGAKCVNSAGLRP
jgi:hypothetical protein